MKTVFVLLIVILSINYCVSQGSTYTCKRRDRSAVCEEASGHCPIDDEGIKDCSAVLDNVVCATYKDSEYPGNYYDGCHACNDPNVISYQAGECQYDLPVKYTCKSADRKAECSMTGGGCWVNVDESSECGNNNGDAVCATMKNGMLYTMMSGCMACRDKNVVSYVDQPCPYKPVQGTYKCTAQDRAAPEGCTALAGGCWELAEGIRKCDNEPRYPVCATFKDGTEETYGDTCSACRNADVDSYTEGECSKFLYYCADEDEADCTEAAYENPMCAINSDDSRYLVYEGCPCKEDVVSYYYGKC
jgi:hypothetical protein